MLQSFWTLGGSWCAWWELWENMPTHPRKGPAWNLTFLVRHNQNLLAMKQQSTIIYISTLICNYLDVISPCASLDHCT